MKLMSAEKVSAAG